MKILQLVFLNMFLLGTLVAKAQTFDLVSYKVPTGWEQSTTDQTMTLSREDSQGNFCLITLYRSIESVEDSEKNFQISWESLVQNILQIGPATMQPSAVDKGWESQVGSAPFEKGGISGAAILISSTKDSTLINTLILTNTDLFQQEMEAILEGMQVMEQELPLRPSDSQKPEVWMNMQLSASSGEFFQGRTKPKLYVIYPNGDYYPDLPAEGLASLRQTSKNDSWGKFAFSGSKGIFQSKYEMIEVEKISDTEMGKVGYSLNFYKCVPVDGLRLDGQWGTFPDWTKDPVSGSDGGMQGSGVRAVIEFRSDGSFTDFGAFVTNLLLPSQDPVRAPGQGTYDIDDFTLILRYEDGREVTKAFTGAGNKDPKIFQKLIYIGTQPFYFN